MMYMNHSKQIQLGNKGTIMNKKDILQQMKMGVKPLVLTTASSRTQFYEACRELGMIGYSKRVAMVFKCHYNPAGFAEGADGAETATQPLSHYSQDSRKMTLFPTNGDSTTQKFKYERAKAGQCLSQDMDDNWYAAEQQGVGWGFVKLNECVIQMWSIILTETAASVNQPIACDSNGTSLENGVMLHAKRLLRWLETLTADESMEEYQVSLTAWVANNESATEE
jgi:hypothetical protein